MLQLIIRKPQSLSSWVLEIRKIVSSLENKMGLQPGKLTHKDLRSQEVGTVLSSCCINISLRWRSFSAWRCCCSWYSLRTRCCSSCCRLLRNLACTSAAWTAWTAALLKGRYSINLSCSACRTKPRPSHASSASKASSGSSCNCCSNQRSACCCGRLSAPSRKKCGNGCDRARGNLQRPCTISWRVVVSSWYCTLAGTRPRSWQEEASESEIEATVALCEDSVKPN